MRAPADSSDGKTSACRIQNSCQVSDWHSYAVKKWSLYVEITNKISPPRDGRWHRWTYLKLKYMPQTLSRRIRRRNKRNKPETQESHAYTAVHYVTRRQKKLRLEGKSLTEAALRIICRQSDCKDWIHSVRYIAWTQQYEPNLKDLAGNFVHVFCKYVTHVSWC